MSDVRDLRPLPIFEGLSDQQIGELVAEGDEVEFAVGEELFVEGEPAETWWVLLSGRIDLVRHVGREETQVGTMDVPGRWAGGFRAWDEHGVYLASGRGSVAGRVLRIPAEVLRERTGEWFPLGGHLIEGVFRTARRIEGEVRQREALVALGTLAAGLMHEINNPAAAATRGLVGLENACDTMLSSLRGLASGSITAEQFVALDTLRSEIDGQASSSEALAAADREDALSAWMASHGVERSWQLAPPLAAGGVDVAWCDLAADVLDEASLETGLAWVASTLTTWTLLEEVRESMRRISDLVGAAKSYSQLDRASMQETDVAEGLESTLVMLAYRTPPGVTVVRDYLDWLPRIEASAGELNQVWTNLITNALDAIGEAGTLRVTARPDGDGVLVEVADTGPGMPREVLVHAFEPFYTTKGVGKGTGLGLDISRRIVVDRHTGKIDIESQPGATVVRVRLPARPKDG